MYFLTEEETRWLLKHLIPRAREEGVAPELRGWNWHDSPIEPPYDVRLTVSEVSGKYCPTGRDLFLKKVEGLQVPPSPAMLYGAACHSAVAQIIEHAKRLVYVKGPSDLDGIAAGLREFRPSLSFPEGVGEAERLSVVDRVQKVCDFEVPRLVTRIAEVVAKQPYSGCDSLVAQAIPVVCEQKLDGRFLGLSSLLSCDSAFMGSAVIFDIKFGQKRDFHRLGVTAYALVMESLWEFPVDVGCVVYVDLRGSVPVITRDLFIIDDELRQWLIDERDDKMRIVYEEHDPGIPDECPEFCAYRPTCLEGKTAGRRSATGGLSSMSRPSRERRISVSP